MQQKFNLQFISTITASLLILSLYLWQHFNGGVPSHHILGDKNLPKLSNWWGAILIPFMTYFLSGKIEKRIDAGNRPIQYWPVIFRFVGAILFGLVVVLSFFNDYRPIMDNLLYFILLVSLFVPIYYAEYILGFVFGTTYGLGAVLPTIFISVFAGIGFLIYRYLRPLFLKLVSK